MLGFKHIEQILFGRTIEVRSHNIRLIPQIDARIQKHLFQIRLGAGPSWARESYAIGDIIIISNKIPSMDRKAFIFHL